MSAETAGSPSVVHRDVVTTPESTGLLTANSTTDAPMMQLGGLTFTFVPQYLHPTVPTTKPCGHPGCDRPARGCGRTCSRHREGNRPGRKCQHMGCDTPAKEGGLCKAHGGGRRCKVIGCTKSAQEGGVCIAHGGGRVCKVDDCQKLAKHGGLCISHGGGTRCKEPNCTKSSQVRGLCKAHGGGNKCKIAGCTKFTQSHGLCSIHGGGKRCSQHGCRRLTKTLGGSHCDVHDRQPEVTNHVNGCTQEGSRFDETLDITSTAQQKMETLGKHTTVFHELGNAINQAKTSKDVNKPKTSSMSAAPDAPSKKAEREQNLEPAPPGGLMDDDDDDTPASLHPDHKKQCCKNNCMKLGGVCNRLLHALVQVSHEEFSSVKDSNAKRKRTSIIRVC